MKKEFTRFLFYERKRITGGQEYFIQPYDNIKINNIIGLCIPVGKIKSKDDLKKEISKIYGIDKDFIILV